MAPQLGQRRDFASMALVVLLLIGTVVMGWQEVLRSRLVSEGSAAPAFELRRWAGAPVQLAQLQGQVVLLNFWATWCPPCREEMPDLLRVTKEFEAQGVTLLAVNSDDVDGQEEAVAGFIRAMPDLGPYVALGTPAVNQAYLVRSLPTNYVIDRQGRIVAARSGQASLRQLRQWLQTTLASNHR